MSMIKHILWSGIWVVETVVSYTAMKQMRNFQLYGDVACLILCVHLM